MTSSPEYFPSLSSAGSAPVPTQLAISCDLMQQYRVATPFSMGDETGGAILATTLDPVTRQTEVFSIGAAGRIYVIRHDPESDTDWSSLDLGFPAQATSIAAGTYPDGSRVIYAVDTKGTVYSKRGGSSWEGAWRVYPKLVNKPIPNTSAVVDGVWVQAIVYDRGNMPVATFVLHAGDGVRGFASNDGTIWTIHETLIGLGGPSYSGFIATADGAGEVGVYYVDTIDDASFSLKADVAHASIDGWYWPSSCARSAQGFDELIATDNPGGEAHSAWLMALDAVAGRFTPSRITPPGVSVRKAVARRKANGLLDVFVLDSNFRLQHGRQDPASAMGWSEFLPFALDQRVVHMVVGQNGIDQSEVFAVTEDRQVWHIWEDSIVPGVIRDPVWHVDRVEVEASTQVEEIRAYVAQVLVFDAQMNALSGAQVRLTSDDGVWIEVNGNSFYLDKTHPWEGPSNSMGQVQITVATDSLGVPALSVWTSNLAADAAVAMDLGRLVQDKLAGADPKKGIDAAQLLAAKMKDADGNATLPLLGQGYRDEGCAASIALAINQSIAMLQNAGKHNAAAPPDIFHPANDHRITTYIQGHGNGPLRLLHRPSIPEQAWRVSFASGKPVFAYLSPDEVQLHLAHAHTLDKLTVDNGWSWGDIFEAVKSGLATVYEYVVQPVVDAVNAVITLVIDGVHHLFECLVNLVEQVFDLVEECFRNVKVGFEQLFLWLGEVLGWPGVLRTKEALKTGMLEMLHLATRAVPAMEGLITGKIAAFQQTIKESIPAFNRDYLGTNLTLGANRQWAFGKTPPDSARDLNRMMSMNLFQSAMVNNLHRISAAGPTATLLLASDAQGVLEDVVSRLQTIGSNFEASNAFRDAANYFEQIKDDPAHIIQLSISALISALEGIVLLVLDVAIELIHLLGSALVAAVKAFEAAFTDTKAWTIPFVSPLYLHVTGSELSALDLAALLIALPTTLIYRMRYGATPFPDDAAVHRFQATVNADALWRCSTLGGPATAVRTGTDAGVLSLEEVSTMKRVFQIGNLCNNVVYGFVDVFLDAQIAPDIKNPNDIGDNRNNLRQIGVASWLAAANGWAAALFSMPWPDLRWQAPGCANSKEFGVIHWFAQLVPNVVGTVWLLSAKSLPRSAELGGACLTSAFGFADLVLTIVEGVMASNEDDGDPLDTMEGVFACIPVASKFLHTKWVMEATECTSVVLLLFIDAACDAGAAACSIATVVTSHVAAPA